jgi:hypothetical protein
VAEVITVAGPTVEVTGTLIYQITLASGVIVTDPAAFSRREAQPVSDVPVFTEDGRPLVVARP